MFGIRDAEMVREVVRSGGFRAAGLSLGLSQSAISTRIAALEKRLGVALFDRSRRKVRLTLEGRRFLDEVERLVALRDQIAAHFTGRSTKVGTLRLGIAETIVHTRMAAIMKALQDSAPGVRVELAVDTSPNLAARLEGDDIDLAALMAQFVPPGAATYRLGRFELGWYAAPALAIGDAPLDLAGLARWPIVTFSRDTLPYREVERLFAQPETPPPLLHGSASLATVLNLVADGVGIGTLPASMAAEALAQGRIARIKVVKGARLSPLDFMLCHQIALGPDIEAAFEALD